MSSSSTTNHHRPMITRHQFHHGSIGIRYCLLLLMTWWMMIPEMCALCGYIISARYLTGDGFFYLLRWSLMKQEVTCVMLWYNTTFFTLKKYASEVSNQYTKKLPDILQGRTSLTTSNDESISPVSTTVTLEFNIKHSISPRINRCVLRNGFLRGSIGLQIGMHWRRWLEMQHNIRPRIQMFLVYRMYWKACISERDNGQPLSQ